MAIRIRLPHGLFGSSRVMGEALTWIRRYRDPTGARLRFFSFPHAGGSAALFNRWSGLLPHFVDFCAVELPGRGTRLGEPCFSQVAPLVGALAGGLESTLDLPFCFFGTSFGALIAFDLSRHLRRRGGPQPLKLFVAARQAPHLPDRNPLHQLGHSDFVAALRSYGGTPGEVLEDSDMQSILLPSLRADFTADETYAWVHGPPLRCPISAFGGRDDRITTEDELTAWSLHTQGSFRLRMLSGGHFFPFSRHGEQALLRAIMDDLDAHPLELGR